MGTTNMYNRFVTKNPIFCCCSHNCKNTKTYQPILAVVLQNLVKK